MAIVAIASVAVLTSCAGPAGPYGEHSAEVLWQAIGGDPADTVTGPYNTFTFEVERHVEPSECQDVYALNSAELYNFDDWQTSDPGFDTYARNHLKHGFLVFVGLDGDESDSSLAASLRLFHDPAGARDFFERVDQGLIDCPTLTNLYKGKPDGTYSFTRFDVPLEHWQAVGWTQRVDTGDPSNSVIAMNDNMAVMIWSSGDDFSAFAARIADKLAIIDNTGP